jgi:AcrR family transcriptional regulator
MKLSRKASAAPVASPADGQGATRVALLDAAERLFAESGVEGTSVRAITKAAGANLGAINYHFGTKERLALEVFARRLEPLNRERIARLDALESGAGRRKLKLESIIDALVRPAVEGAEQTAAKCDDLMRVVSRSFQEPNPEVKKFVEQQFSEVIRRFDTAMLRVLPSLDAAELFWRMTFLFGALHHGQQVWLRFDLLPTVHLHDAAVKPDREGFIRRFIAFVCAGLSTPR